MIEWVLSVAFLWDVTQQLNEPNLKMQGRNKTVYELYTAVRVFSDKLDVLDEGVCSSDYRFFLTVQKVMAMHADALLPCQSQFYDMMSSSKITPRFNDFKDHSNILLFVKNPFLIEDNEIKQ